MSNRTDWPELADEIMLSLGMPLGVMKFRERIERELHNAFVAGQEASTGAFKVGKATPEQLAALKSLTPRALTISFSEWTTKPPTQPGWYWAVRRGGRPETVRVVMRERLPMDTAYESRRFVVDVIGGDEQDEFSDYTHWAGPIEAPPLPEAE